MVTYPRAIDPLLSSQSSANKARILLGARQTGKSTLLGRLANEDALIFNLQERKTRLELERDPSILTQQLRADPRPRLDVLIDEIQRIPALLDEVQCLYDEAPGRYRFVLTGSSARKLKRTSANLLPGRSHVFHLCPLVLAERGYPPGQVFPSAGESPAPAPAFPRAGIEPMLLHGNLPGVALERAESAQRTLEGYVVLYLEEEIRREALVRDLGAFQQFLELAALESGQIVNLSALSRETGVPLPTLRGYYQVLEDTFVGYRIPAFGQGGRKRVLTTPRFLFFDPGVRNAASRLGFSPAVLKTQSGLLLENWVGLELYHRCLHAGRTHRLSFWRTAHGAEVDYVLDTPDETIPIEVKWTESPHATDTRHLNLFLDTYPDRARRGFLVCRCSAPRKMDDRITAVPWHAL
jgi:predicted AAA+ superfamily ATPase